MIRFFKWIFTLSLIGFFLAVLWVGIGVWIGYYSVYSFPPSELHPDGATLIVDREASEPSFNSPDYIPPPREPGKKEPGIGFGTTEFRRTKPVRIRTLFTLPFIPWAYEQSLNEEQRQKLEKQKLQLKKEPNGRPTR